MADPAVECYSGHTYAQEPRALMWQGQRYSVLQVEQRWQRPEGPAFWVRTTSGDRFEVQYHERQERWLVRDLPATEYRAGKGADILAFPSQPLSPADSNIKDKEVQD